MTPRVHGIRSHRFTLTAVALAAAVLVSACHDAPPGSPAQPVKRRATKPTERTAPPGPALLDTVKPWRTPPVEGQQDWQLAIAELEETEYRIAYRAPFSWDVDGLGRARSGDGLVQARATLTPLSDEQLSMATYLAQLAEGQPIWSRTTQNGYTVYMVEREVSVAPSDPNVAERYYHTGVVDIGGRIAKLDVLYESRVHWRFGDVANAIISTMDVQRRP